jgi:hypothetical protein
MCRLLSNLLTIAVRHANHGPVAVVVNLCGRVKVDQVPTVEEIEEEQ